ncbi:ABC transporter permease (plasmid) [Rhizobium sp. T1470]|uniref:ABC transporter permease n=1 Tax=unclassified Rhizobium TaxID=2613769 RepID=UPI001AAFE928|nr:ABC transporter permease [Rhizobium sp. T1473]MCA0806082.1 ABC transporter permease [Rhizobium sp. T1473]
MVPFLKLSRPFSGLTLPALAILLAIFGIPMVQLLFTSFNAPAFTLANYQAFVDQTANLRVLSQTIEMSLVATTLCVVIGYPTAYVIAASSKQLRATLIGFVVISYLTSLLARTYAWILILGDRGLINNFLLDLGLISSPLPLIYNCTAVYIGMVQIMLPVMVLPLITVMVGIEQCMHPGEAALLRSERNWMICLYGRQYRRCNSDGRNDRGPAASQPDGDCRQWAASPFQ